MKPLRWQILYFFEFKRAAVDLLLRRQSLFGRLSAPETAA
jgi:hypothetical protein